METQETSLGSDSQALTPYHPPSSPGYYSQAITVISSVGNAVGNVIVSIPGYFSTPSLSLDLETEKKRQIIAYLMKQVSTAQQTVVEKQKNFEMAWGETLEIQIKALQFNNQAFETMQKLIDSLLEFKAKVIANNDLSNFMESSTNLSEIQQISPIKSLCTQLKKQIDYFTTGQCEENPDEAIEKFNTLDIIRILNESSMAVKKYELKRIKDRLDRMIEKTIEKSKPKSLPPDPENLKIFKTLEPAIKLRRIIEGDLYACLSFFNSLFSGYLDINIPVEEPKTSYLGWFGSAPSHAPKALPEFSNKPLASAYNIYNEKALEALEEFRSHFAKLNIAAEEYKAANTLLHSLIQEKNRLENSVPKLTIVKEGEEGTDNEEGTDEEEDNVFEDSSYLVTSDTHLNPEIDTIRQQNLGSFVFQENLSIYDGYLQVYQNKLPPLENDEDT